MPESVDISIVVCTYSRSEMLRPALESLAVQNTGGQFRYEIIVVDDAAGIGTMEAVDAIAGQTPVTIRYTRQNGHGIGDARNRGTTLSQAKWIAFFDDDQVAPRGWLKSLWDVASRHGADCVGGPRYLKFDSPEPPAYGPRARALLGENIFSKTPAKCRGRYIPTCGNLLVKRDLLLSAGLFDTSMQFGGEDSELVERLRDNETDIWISPEAMVYHVIKPYRIRSSYLRWVAIRWGCQRAYMDFKSRGLMWLLVFFLARAGQAMLVYLPRLLVAGLKHERASALDCRCQLWRAEAYLRRAACLVSPRMLAQKQYFEFAQFGNARQWSSSYSTDSVGIEV